MGDIKETFYNTVAPLDFAYNYRVGSCLQRYIDALKERKILGAKCPQCAGVVVPPRKYCGECNRVRDEFVELSQEGTLENHTVGHVKLERGALSRSESGYVIGMIRLDGADNLLVARVEGVALGEVRAGMRVRAVWSEETTGDYSDLDHFEPV